MFIEAIYIVLWGFLFDYLIYKVIFYSLYLFIYFLIFSKCNPKFLAKNLRKSLVLNGLCLVWPIFDPPKNTFIVFYCQQIFVADSFKTFLNSCQPQNFEINKSFNSYFVCITSSVLFNNHEKVPKNREELL